MSAYERPPRKSGSSVPTTPWSHWEWNKDYRCFSRYRQSGAGSEDKFEYEYDQVDAAPDLSLPPQYYNTDKSLNYTMATEVQGTHENSQILPFENLKLEPTSTEYQTDIISPNLDYSLPDQAQTSKKYDGQEKLDRSARSSTASRLYTCQVWGCKAGVKCWTTLAKLKAHENNWHGRYSCFVRTCPRCAPNGFSSQVELDDHIESIHSGISDGSLSRSISRKSSYAEGFQGSSSGPPSDLGILSSRISASPSGSYIRSNFDRVSERFDKSYKLHNPFEFKQFCVFKVLWSEPQGSSQDVNGQNNTVSIRESNDGRIYEKVRRFVIMASMRGHCLCLPLNTYLKQGTLKSGVHAEDHAIAHTSRKPQSLKGELEKGLTRSPIRIEPSTPRDKLEPQTRLNYAKIYTVEFNIKVCFVGKVHVNYRDQVVQDYNDLHPPMQNLSKVDVIPDRILPSRDHCLTSNYTVESTSNNYTVLNASPVCLPYERKSALSQNAAARPRSFPENMDPVKLQEVISGSMPGLDKDLTLLSNPTNQQYSEAVDEDYEHVSREETGQVIESDIGYQDFYKDK